MSVNKAIIVGRLGGDPELRFIPSGRAVANFNIATDSVWKDREGQRQKQTEWHRIVVWGPQAETCSKYLAKGREVYVEGEIRTRSYDDKDGNKRYVTQIVATSASSAAIRARQNAATMTPASRWRTATTRALSNTTTCRSDLDHGGGCGGGDGREGQRGVDVPVVWMPDTVAR